MKEPLTNIFREFAEVVRRQPTAPAVFFKGEDHFHTLTYQEIFARSLKLGGILTGRGLKRSDKVAILIGNQSEWVVSFLATQCIGAIAVPIDLKLSSGEISKLISHCGAKIVLCSTKTISTMEESLKETDTLTVDAPGFLDCASDIDYADAMSSAISSDDICAFFYTSGTTNDPKAVMLSHRNLLSNTDSIARLGFLTPKDVFISILPLHHTFAFTGTFLLPLMEGAAISYPSCLSAPDLLECMNSTNVSIVAGVPRLFIMFHKGIAEKLRKLPFAIRFFTSVCSGVLWSLRKFTGINLSKNLFSKLHSTFGSGLRFMISGGAHLSADITRDFFKWGFTLLEGYGLTETAPIVTINRPDTYKIGSVGETVPDVSVMLADMDLEGRGEVLIKGPNVMSGYYKQPDETKKRFRDGWFLSGDLGYFDKCKRLHLVGRKDEMISLSTGENVNPDRVESHYSSSAYIEDICVFLSKGTGYFQHTDQLVAVVVPDEAFFHKHKQVNIDDRIKWELDHLSHGLRVHEKIKGFVISRDKLPRTTLGKLKRRLILEKYLAGNEEMKSKTDNKLDNDAERILSSKVCQDALKFISKRMNKEVTIHDHLELDLGVDSLGRIELLLDLQEFLNITVPEDDLENVFYADTLKQLFLKVEPFLPEKLTLSDSTEFNWAEVFKTEPSPELLDSIRLVPTVRDKVLSFLMFLFLKIFFKLYFRLSVKNKNNIPRKGPFIIIPNHESFLDGPIVFASLPFRAVNDMFFFGFRKHFMPMLSPEFLKTTRIVPLDAALNLINTMQVASYLLKNNKGICYFPEGQRSPDGKLLPFKKGIGILAKEAKPDFVPIYIKGSFEAWPNYIKYPRPRKIEVEVGQPLSYSNILSRIQNETADYNTIANALRDVLIEFSSGPGTASQNTHK